MSTPRRDVRLLVLGASLGSKSLNNRLALLAGRVAESKGAPTKAASKLPILRMSSQYGAFMKVLMPANAG